MTVPLSRYERFIDGKWGIAYFIGWTVYLFVGMFGSIPFMFNGQILIGLSLLVSSVVGYGLMRIIDKKYNRWSIA